MRLRHLRIHQLRNLGQAELKEPSGISILYGENGSGKTSVLEAIHLIAMARPFRRAQFKPLIQQGTSELQVYATLSADANSPTTSVGIKRTENGLNRTLLNNTQVSSASVLADILPIQIVDSSVFQLLEGGSSLRREFMDWGTFHVKPSFREHWRRAARCTRQRNILLRTPSIDEEELKIWSVELARCALELDNIRKTWFGVFLKIFYRVLKELYPDHNEHKLEMRYYRGWGDYDLQNKLLSDWEEERIAGFTRVGPHKADLKFKIGPYNASAVLSRGQIKLVATALRLAQAEYLHRSCNKNSIFLVDDLAAELDRSSRARLCHLLEQSQHQVFISCIELDDLHGFWKKGNSASVFHVKHGKIEEIPQ